MPTMCPETPSYIPSNKPACPTPTNLVHVRQQQEVARHAAQQAQRHPHRQQRQLGRRLVSAPGQRGQHAQRAQHPVQQELLLMLLSLCLVGSLLRLLGLL